MSDIISIRPLTHYDEYLQCEDIQRKAWKMTDDRDVVPAHMLKPVAEYGGIVLGAFHQTAGLIGFVFGFVGKVDDERAEWMNNSYVLCSEMMGVLPEYRSHSVGYRLKLAQREYALAQGYKLIIWTYDPLLSLNARLNIGKLGCVCHKYIRDAYGQMGGIYAGVSTDRFAIEWWIASKRTQAQIEHPEIRDHEAWIEAGAQLLNPAQADRHGLLRPASSQSTPINRLVSVEFPADFQAVKQADAGLAQAWRAQTRMVFEELFAKGYVVSAFARSPEHNLSSFYILQNDLDIASIARE